MCLCAFGASFGGEYFRPGNSDVPSWFVAYEESCFPGDKAVLGFEFCVGDVRMRARSQLRGRIRSTGEFGRAQLVHGL